MFMNCYKYLLSALSLSLAFSVGTALKAQAAELGYTSRGGTEEDNSFLTLGFQFTPTENVPVSGLGVYTGGSANNAKPQGDVDVPRPVGLWRADNQQLLAQVTVNPGDNLCQDNFCFANLAAPLNLTAGVDYRVGAYYEQDEFGDKLIGTVVENVDPRLNIDTSQSYRTVNFFEALNEGITNEDVINSSLNYPDRVDVEPNTGEIRSFSTTANVAIGEPVAQVTEVPERSSVIALCLLGLGGFLFKRK